MELLFLLSLHLFLIICYYILIETKRSRLSYGHLLFAVFLPFVGELCLIAADLGKSPAVNDFVKPFKDFNKMQEQIAARSIDIPNEEEISREFLLEIIKDNPENITEILKKALNSSDIEVVHLAAASIMKLQREFENNIKAASVKYAEMPNNMNRLKQYITVIGEYYECGLLSGESALSLLEQQENLLGKYLNVFPEDKEMGICFVKNSLHRGKFELALEKAEFMRCSDISDIELWEQSVEVCKITGASKLLQEIIDEANKLSIHWSRENKQHWAEIKKGLSA